MTSVGAPADIWSVGCLALELLTGAPPYFDLQPMSALFRIVADSRPPLPETLSPDMYSFLMQCFQKVCAAACFRAGYAVDEAVCAAPNILLVYLTWEVGM